jgi:D-tyrosyl-tRNA(Tyr) deacylase
LKAVIQRVDQAKLTVDNKTISQINKGLLVYLGINEHDTMQKAQILAAKVAALRIFRDENDKLNLSVKDIGGEALVVSNFTIYGDTSRGNRPNFMYAMKGELALPIYEYFVECLNQQIPTQKGAFGEHMKIEQINNGPINIIMEV